MQSWLGNALVSLLIFGLWGFFPKLAVRHLSPRSALIYEVAGALLVGLAALAAVDFRPEVHARGILFALLTGVAGMLGTLFYFAAARDGKIAVVVSITALYPLVTIILALAFLKEPLTIKQTAGMALALAAILLLTS